jgi:DNA-binding Xre family transcriptional regulator
VKIVKLELREIGRINNWRQRFSRLLAERRLRPVQVARRMQISYRRLNAIMASDRMRLDTFERLCQAMGVTWEDWERAPERPSAIARKSAVALRKSADQEKGAGLRTVLEGVLGTGSVVPRLRKRKRKVKS